MNDNSYNTGSYDDTTRETTSLLNMAQRIHDDYITEAKEASENMVAEAKNEAALIVAEARKEAQAIVESANEEADSLEEHIETLKAVELEYRARLKSAADETLTKLENMTLENEGDNLSAEAENQPFALSFNNARKS